MLLMRDATATGRVPLLLQGKAGVRGDGIAVGGNFPSPLANDGAEPSDQLVWLLIPPLPESGGTTDATDAGAYKHSLPSEAGTYTQDYRVFTFPEPGSIIDDTWTITMQVEADELEPLVESVTIGSVGANSAVATVNVNKSAGTIFVLVSSAATVSDAEVLASALTRTVSALTPQLFTLTDLPPSTTRYVHVIFRDALGTDSVQESTSFTTSAAPDTTPPVMSGGVNITNLVPGSFTSSVNAATDNVGVVAYEVSVDEGVSWISKGTTRNHAHSGAEGSTVVVQWRALDAANNAAVPVEAEVTIPFAAPTGVVQSHGPVNGNFVSVNGSYTGQVTSGEMTLVNLSGGSNAGPFALSFTQGNTWWVYTPQVANGTYRAEFDLTGPGGTVEFNAIGNIVINVAAPIDDEPPQMHGEVHVTDLTKTSYRTGVDEATDNVGVTGYRVSEDGGTNWTLTGYSRTYLHTGRTPGQMDTVLWSARDAAGNWAEPLLKVVTPLPNTTNMHISPSDYRLLRQRG